ncbi:hypothetical protein POSPLADRAFT_1054050 [Postia placenta MAD-698-R-SB12]|uniref:Nucleoporin Nup133/Nup155-like C-terminal domain-containing protein n=1 Tax=Postia placenta MAD-698-R-SB12 TaxID=670580 RepID=A0A1X6N9U9_9APHY|nr:hypothetical protein POSPLADRAFT_1054050 [Postia placenta MAD-698-R-SB12]OSX65290.1 hypothetical protein POSPLADRAFT_1054050 [Postia placenta MAD-698-R-SB12]
MDVDEDMMHEHTKDENLFAKSSELTAAFYSHLPVEVKQILKNADFYSQGFTGEVDTLTDYAVVASRETCFVWQYSQALTGIPTCYIFQCPRSNWGDNLSTPFHALVPHGQTREPGLIVISTGGVIRYWDSLGIGLAGGDNFSVTELNLESEEQVTTLTRADPHTYIASTSAGRLFRLSLTVSGGRHHLVFRTFGQNQSSGSLTRLLSFLSSPTSLLPETGNITAVALANETEDVMERFLWIISDTRLQKWSMSVEGWEQLRFEQEVAEQVQDAIRKAFPSAPSDDADLDLELLDLKIESNTRDHGKLLLLISYAAQEEESAMDPNVPPRRIHALVRLSCGQPAPVVTSVQSVPYQSTLLTGAPMHPRMNMILDGELVAVQFGDAVTLCARDNDYMDRFELKSTEDRTLGVGVVPGDSEVLLLTATVLMKALIDMDQVKRYNPQSGRANLIKSIMTQAILYGSSPENPLHFSFPPDIDEEALMSGAEQLSQAVMQSDWELIKPNHDLHTQMSNRKDRLSFLIKFINDNGVLGKMSQRTRQRLATDGEKLYAAHQLWMQHNNFLGASQSNSVLLYDAVLAYMDAVGEGNHDDFVRAFFRMKVEDLGGLLPYVLGIVRQSSYEHSLSLPDDISQANWIVVTILKSAISYREYNMAVYGITLPLLDPWSSQPSVVEVLSELFSLTTKLVETPVADPEIVKARAVPKGQLPELATWMFACIQERLDWLDSPAAAADSASERERIDLENTFEQSRPEILEALRRNKFADEAFQLAEKYRDFRSLASLCHKDTIYPPQDNPNAERIQSYIDKFKEEFTTELYQWYIEHGELRTMFAQQDDEYLDDYFSEHPNMSVSWLHDLGKRRYSLVSEALLTEAGRATELVSKHLVLSIGKLAQIAQLHENNIPIDQSVLDAFHDGLDFVSIHETLIDDLKSALAPLRGKQSLEKQVETIAETKASRLSKRRALQHVFKLLVRRLLQGKALAPEDIAEILSLKDNTNSPESYATALDILNRAQNIPNARVKAAYRSIWRRIYIHDDWDVLRQTVNVTDEEVNARFRGSALYVALRATIRPNAGFEGYIMAPSEALEIPQHADIALRYTGISPDEAEDIRRDLEEESQELAELRMDETFMCIRQLVQDDLRRGE